MLFSKQLIDVLNLFHSIVKDICARDYDKIFFTIVDLIPAEFHYLNKDTVNQFILADTLFYN